MKRLLALVVILFGAQVRAAERLDVFVIHEKKPPVWVRLQLPALCWDY